MNAIQNNHGVSENVSTPNRSLTSACIGSCRKLMEKAKRAILREFRSTLQAHEQLLRLAVTEAEALAWQTPYPHLVFPALAREKAQSVVEWEAHQRYVRRANSSLLRTH